MVANKSAKDLAMPKLPTAEDTQRTIRKIELMGEVNSAALAMWDYHDSRCPGELRCICANKRLRSVIITLAEHEKGGPLLGY